MALHDQDGYSLKQLFSISSRSLPRRCSQPLLRFQSLLSYFRNCPPRLSLFPELQNRHAFIQEFRNWESAWALEPLFVVAYELRVLAEGVVDRELASVGKTPEEKYSNVVQALKSGDLRLLRRALHEHEDRFLRSGVFLVLEKLELQVYQRLVKKIYIIQKHKDPSKAHQLKLEIIVKALKWLEVDMDVDEVECILSILIYKNLMKGYFSHKSKVVVLSKQDPFPKLNGKPVNS